MGCAVPDTVAGRQEPGTMAGDNLAYEYGLITMVMSNGAERKTETFNVFIKEDGAWKLLSNLPVAMMMKLF